VTDDQATPQLRVVTDDLLERVSRLRAEVEGLSLAVDLIGAPPPPDEYFIDGGGAVSSDAAGAVWHTQWKYPYLSSDPVDIIVIDEDDSIPGVYLRDNYGDLVFMSASMALSLAAAVKTATNPGLREIAERRSVASRRTGRRSWTCGDRK
jgi:hypothetical protein